MFGQDKQTMYENMNPKALRFVTTGNYSPIFLLIKFVCSHLLCIFILNSLSNSFMYFLMQLVNKNFIYLLCFVIFDIIVDVGMVCLTTKLINSLPISTYFAPLFIFFLSINSATDGNLFLISTFLLVAIARS